MTDEPGTERIPTPEQASYLHSSRMDFQESLADFMRDYLQEVEGDELALRLQAAIEGMAFTLGHLDGVTALSGTSASFRAELLAVWMDQGRAVALDQHRRVCAGCPADRALAAAGSPS